MLGRAWIQNNCKMLQEVEGVYVLEVMEDSRSTGFPKTTVQSSYKLTKTEVEITGPTMVCTRSSVHIVLLSV